MDIEKITELAINGNAHVQVPPYFQAGIFGLDASLLRQLASMNARGLDIGCGNGSLVKYLREKEVSFEGIDSQAPQAEYFMKQNITGMKPMAGAIPRPDNSYELVVAFQNIMLNRAFTKGGILHDPTKRDGESWEIEDHESRVRTGQFIFYEGARVVKPGGRFLIYPEAKRIDDLIGRGMLSMQGITYHSEDVDETNAKKYMRWELQKYGLDEDMQREYLGEQYFEDWGLYQRTVVMKSK